MKFARHIYTESSILKAACCLKRLDESGDGPLDELFRKDFAGCTDKEEIKNFSDIKSYCVSILKKAFLENLRNKNLQGIIALEKMYERYCKD